MNNIKMIISIWNNLFMEFKALKIFVEIVRSQGFSQAAERLFLTQPAVSKAIGQLESELGCELFKKGKAGRKRDIRLTYLGEQIYQHALIILDEQKKITDTIQQIQSLQKGKLTLGLPPLGSVLFSSLIALFHQKYPEIELNFLEVGANGIEQAILAKTVDVGILLGELKPVFNSIPVVNSSLCLLSVSNSIWKGRTTVRLAELKTEDFLFYDDSFSLNNMITEAAHQAGFVPHVICKSSQWDFIAKMVESGMGIALLPELYCNKLDPSKFNISILQEPSLNWTLSMAWDSTASMSAATRAWLNIIEDNRQLIHL